MIKILKNLIDFSNYKKIRIMEKQIFKVGDRVFDIRYGWGKVTICADTILYPIGVQFNEDDSQEVILYTEDGKGHLGDNKPVLSFTEYGFDNRFSQKRVFDYKNCIGKYGKFWDDGENTIIVGKLCDYYQYHTHHFRVRTHDDEIGFYTNFEPLTEKQVKVLEL